MLSGIIQKVSGVFTGSDPSNEQSFGSATAAGSNIDNARTVITNQKLNPQHTLGTTQDYGSFVIIDDPEQGDSGFNARENIDQLEDSKKSESSKMDKLANAFGNGVKKVVNFIDKSAEKVSNYIKDVNFEEKLIAILNNKDISECRSFFSQQKVVDLDESRLNEILLVADKNCSDRKFFAQMLTLVSLELQSEVTRNTVVKFIIDHNLITEYSNSPAPIWAIKKGYKSTAEILISARLNLEVLDTKKNSALISAVRKGWEDTVDLLIANNAKCINYGNANGNTALIFAAQSGSTEIVKLLIDKGADVNHRNANGSTALIFAAKRGNTEIFKILIDKDADVKHSDSNGVCAFLWAINNGNIDTVNLLIKNQDIDVNKVDRQGNSALIFAASSGNKKIIELLLSKDKRSINHINNGGYTALLCAIASGHVETVKLLIESGADVNLRNSKNGNTPLECAKALLENAKTLLKTDEICANQKKNNKNYLKKCTWVKAYNEIVNLLENHISADQPDSPITQSASTSTRSAATIKSSQASLAGNANNSADQTEDQHTPMQLIEDSAKESLPSRANQEAMRNKDNADDPSAVTMSTQEMIQDNKETSQDKTDIDASSSELTKQLQHKRKKRIIKYVVGTAVTAVLIPASTSISLYLLWNYWPQYYKMVIPFDITVTTAVTTAVLLAIVISSAAILYDCCGSGANAKLGVERSSQTPTSVQSVFNVGFDRSNEARNRRHKTEAWQTSPTMHVRSAFENLLRS